MSSVEIWATIVALAVATVITRSAFWMIGHHITIPRRIQEILRYAPACALAAIVAPDLLLSNAAQIDFSLANLKLVAGVASIVFFLLRRNMLQTIVFGMLALTVLRLLHVGG